MQCAKCGISVSPSVLICPKCGSRSFAKNDGTTSTQPSSKTQSSKKTQPTSKQTSSAHVNHQNPAQSARQAPVNNPPQQAQASQLPAVKKRQPSKNNQHPLKMASSMQYASFWRRLAAYVVDGVILNIAWFIIIQVLPLSLFINEYEEVNTIGVTSIFVATLVTFCLYSAFFESGAKQGTLGKQLMGLWVFDEQGQRLSFGRALARAVGKLFSLASFIGCIMILFTQRRQGLHDKVAKTFVLHSPE